MKLSHTVRLFIVVLIALVACGVAFQPIRFEGAVPIWQGPRANLNLGLDLQGGSHIELQAVPTAQTAVNDDAMNGVLSVIRNRVDQLGVSEPNIVRQGRDRIVIELPGIKDPARALDIIGKTALLEFVDTGTVSLPENATWINQDTVQEPPTNTTIKVAKNVLLTGADLAGAAEQYDPTYGTPEVAFTFKSSAARKFEDYTAKNIGKYLTIVLDNKVISSPVIQSAIPGGKGVINGSFTLESASELAVLLRAGALPIPVKVVENQTIGPLLGKDSIDRSVRAGEVAMVMVALFMFLYYRFSGFLADIALVVYTLIVFALMTGIGAALSLPGIAGFILSLGVAVDANVIIFEKVKEELRAQKSLRASVAAGWSRAIVTILDSNATTLIGAFVLLWLGTGPVRGFAVTLILGILTSIFTAIVVTRVFVDVALDTPTGSRWIQHLGDLPRKTPATAAGTAGAGE